MKKNIILFALILILIPLVISCNEILQSDLSFENEEDIIENGEKESVSIMNMSDLEIIKKSSDYLKSFGKSLVFEETKILYRNNSTSKIICKGDPNGGDLKDIFYEGDYLSVYFYPHSKMAEGENILIVYIDDSGKVLGFEEE